MRIRTVQLACLILLLSSLSAAKGTTLRSGEFGLGGHYISTLLAQDNAATADEASLSARFNDTRTSEIPTTAEAHVRTVWSMRPPAAHSAAVHALTGTSV
jgi:hypothetical protein